MALQKPTRSRRITALLFSAEFLCFCLFLFTAMPAPRSTPDEHVPPTGLATVAGVALFAFLLLYSRVRSFAARCWVTLLYVIAFGGAMALTWSQAGW